MKISIISLLYILTVLQCSAKEIHYKPKGFNDSLYVQWEAKTKKLPGKGKYLIELTGKLSDPGSYIYSIDQYGRTINNASTQLEVYSDNIIKSSENEEVDIKEKGGKVIWYKDGNGISEYRRYNNVIYLVKIRLDTLRSTKIDIVLKYNCGNKNTITDDLIYESTIEVGTKISKTERKRIAKNSRKRMKLKQKRNKIKRRIERRYPWM